jgi:hypothetical protein
MPIPPEAALAAVALLAVSFVGIVLFEKWKRARSQRRDKDE